uniref:Era-type G domain-containing protein n=1 Tax=Caenorhabditis tropicalis TaxID=1561998 RepID=A0A1I7T4B2_9PELO
MLIKRFHVFPCRLFSTASTSTNYEKTPTNPATKCLQLAVIGAPNVGKSLLTNSLIRCPLSAVSSKMDTTTRNISASICTDSTQLVFVDSPGAVSTSHVRQTMKKTSATSGDRVLQDPERALQRAQHILVVQDSTAPGSYIHHRVLHMLHRYSHVPSTLVMNKIDLVMRRSDLLPLVEILTNGQLSDNQQISTKPAQIGRLGKSLAPQVSTSSFNPSDEKWQMKFRELIQKPTWKCSYSETRSLFRTICGWSGFERVFFCSSLTGEGVDELRDHLVNISPDGEWKMQEGMPTGETAQQLCMDSIRAAVLDTTPSNVAYSVQARISEWEENGEVLQIVGEIRCEKPRDGLLIIGKGGKRLAEIGRRVNEHLHSLFQRQLYARLIVTCKGKLVTQDK